MPLKIVSCFVAALLIPTLSAAAVEEVGEPRFLVVVHADNPTQSIERSELARMFLGKLSQWDWGAEVLPADQAAGAPVREAFSEAVLGKGVASVRAYWQRVYYSGRDEPPPEMGSDGEVLDYVRREPGAIGYVSELVSLDGGVRALEVTGGWNGEVIPGVPDPAVQSADPPHRPAADVVVDRHGDVRLLLTGSCGPGGRGRRAVVVSAIPYEPVQVTVETTVWIDGRNKSSSEQTFTVEPLGEQGLDCTRLSDSAEKRFALVRVSDAASHRAPRAGRAAHGRPVHERPAREVVAIVAGGTCGRDRAGRRQMVINRHLDRDVAVEIRVVERVAGRETRSFVRSLRLAPGDEKSLGCSADGRLAREHTVVRAEYR